MESYISNSPFMQLVSKLSCFKVFLKDAQWHLGYVRQSKKLTITSHSHINVTIKYVKGVDIFSQTDLSQFRKLSFFQFFMQRGQVVGYNFFFSHPSKFIYIFKKTYIYFILLLLSFILFYIIILSYYTLIYNILIFVFTVHYIWQDLLSSFLRFEE